MAFKREELAILNSRIGDQAIRATYKTEDSVATVNTSGYFNDYADTLAVGDIIDVVVVTSTGALTGVSTVIVNSVSDAGVVDVTDGTAVGVGDAD